MANTLRWTVLLGAGLALISGCVTAQPMPQAEVMALMEEDLPPAEDPPTQMPDPPSPPPKLVREIEPPPEQGEPKKSPLKIVNSARTRAIRTPDREDQFHAVTEYDYWPDQIYTVYCAVKRFTNIILQSGEELTAPAVAGDTKHWIVAEAESGDAADHTIRHVILKPRMAHRRTNLLLITNRRTYHIELVSYETTYMSAVRWNYPLDAYASLSQRTTRQMEKQQSQIPVTNIEKLNFGYTLKGRDQPWKPELVFDDGRQTFIKFPGSIGAAELPVLFVVTQETDTQIVNYRKKGPFFIVDRLMKRGVLKLGPKARIEIIRNAD